MSDSDLELATQLVIALAEGFKNPGPLPSVSLIPCWWIRTWLKIDFHTRYGTDG